MLHINFNVITKDGTIINGFEMVTDEYGNYTYFLLNNEATIYDETVDFLKSDGVKIDLTGITAEYGGGFLETLQEIVPAYSMDKIKEIIDEIMTDEKLSYLYDDTIFTDYNDFLTFVSYMLIPFSDMEVFFIKEKLALNNDDISVLTADEKEMLEFNGYIF